MPEIICNHEGCDNRYYWLDAIDPAPGVYYCPNHLPELDGLGQSNCRDCKHPVYCELDEVGSGGVSCHRCEFKRGERAKEALDCATYALEFIVARGCLCAFTCEGEEHEPMCKVLAAINGLDSIKAKLGET